MGACRRFGAIALLLLAATAFPLHAGAEPEHIRIQFSAPKKCPDGAAFIRALRQRTGRFQLASGSEQTRLFVVTLTATDSRIWGRLEIQGPGTAASLRSVSGKSCDEIMEALALMTALAIEPNDPSASPPNARSSGATSPMSQAPIGPSIRTPKPKAPEASPATTPAPPAAAPAAGSPTAEEPHAPGPPPFAPALPEASPQAAAAEAPAPKPRPAIGTKWAWSAGVQGGSSLRVSPTPGIGGLLFVEAAAPGTAVLAPVIRAGLFLNQSDATAASGAGAGFQWIAAMVEGCPARFLTHDSRVGFFPCLALHLGALRGQGRNLNQPEETADLWADLGPVARIRVAVLARLSLEAQGMLVLPLRRLTFDVQDRGPAESPTTVFAVPLVGVLAGIGVSYGFE